MKPKASVIVPCWNVQQWVEDAIRSVLGGTFCDFEIVAVDDGSTDATGAILDRMASADARVRVVHQTNRGLCGARNSGLDAAKGKFVFFLDGDDTFAPDFLALGVGEMERTGADFCIFPFAVTELGQSKPRLEILKDDYNLDSQEAIRTRLLPKFIGYSMDHVRRWYGGVPLFAGREMAGVWRCVYRRDLVERWHIRFDENVRLYEDSLFNSEYLLRARKTACRRESVYNYVLHEGGLIAGRKTTVRVFRNKLAMLRARRRLDEIAGGAVGWMFAASCVFSMLEMFALLRTVPIGWAEGRRIVREYAADPAVRTAGRTFPLSWRKPHVALAVIALRVFGAGFVYSLAWTLFAPRRIASPRNRQGGAPTPSTVVNP